MIHIKLLLQIQPRLTVRGITIVCTDRIFDSRQYIYKKIFLKKTPLEVCSPHLYASFGTFYAKIGQLFEAQ